MDDQEVVWQLLELILLKSKQWVWSAQTHCKYGSTADTCQHSCFQFRDGNTDVPPQWRYRGICSQPVSFSFSVPNVIFSMVELSAAVPFHLRADSSYTYPLTPSLARIHLRGVFSQCVTAERLIQRGYRSSSSHGSRCKHQSSIVTERRRRLRMRVTAVVTVALSCVVTCSPHVNELARRPALAICVTAQARSAFLLTSVLVRARRLVRSDNE